MKLLTRLSTVLALLFLAACSSGSSSTASNDNQVTGVDTAPQISVVTAK